MRRGGNSQRGYNNYDGAQSNSGYSSGYGNGGGSSGYSDYGANGGGYAAGYGGGYGGGYGNYNQSSGGYGGTGANTGLLGGGGMNPSAVGGSMDQKSLMLTIQQLQKKVELLETQQGGGGGGAAPAGATGFGRSSGGFGGGASAAGGYPGGPTGPKPPGYGMDSSKTGFDRMSRSTKEGPDGKIEKRYEDPTDPHAGEPERVVLINNIPLDLALPSIIHEEISNFGEVMRIKILHNNRSTALIQMRTREEAQKVVDGQDYLNRNGFRIFCKVSTKFNEVPIPAPGSMQDDGLTQDYTGNVKLNPFPRWNPAMEHMDQGHGGPMGGPMGGPPMGGPFGGQMGGHMGGPMHMGGGDHYGQGMDEGRNNLVVLISNLPDELAQVDKIFNIMGVYGDVLCVKILFQKRDCALVHFAKPHHAAQAKQHLDQFKVGGKNLTLSYSKIRSLLANKLIEEDGLQKQYLNSRSHRYKNPQLVAKITKNLGPPTNILHISNFPEQYNHEDIKEMFIEHGFTAKESRDCEGKAKMCFLVFSSPDEALMALSVMHNYCNEEMKSKNGKGLCVSFTNSMNKPGQYNKQEYN